jgi:hypothetical protein
MGFSISTTEVKMPDTIAVGKMLLKEGTALPGAVQLESEPYAAGWRVVKNLDGYGLERKIHEAGWTFFCDARDVKTTALGFDEQRTVHSAVRQILTELKSSEFNCLEIMGVATRHFLGVPYVSVSARSRHIQKGVVLFQTQELPVTEPARLAAD